MTKGRSGVWMGKTDHGGKKIIIKAVQAGAMACLSPASASPVGCVGEWAAKEGVQCEWVIEAKMGEDNLGLSKLTVVHRAWSLFITVYHFYSWHFNVRETGDRCRGTDSRRENTKGGLELWIMSRVTEREASKNRVGNWCVGLCVCVSTPCFPQGVIDTMCTTYFKSSHSPALPTLQIPPREPRGSWFCPWRQRGGWEAVAAHRLQGEIKTHWTNHTGAEYTVNTIQHLTIK